MMDLGLWIGLLFEDNVLKLMFLRNVLMVGIMLGVPNTFEVADGSVTSVEGGGDGVWI